MSFEYFGVLDSIQVACVNTFIMWCCIQHSEKVLNDWY